MGLLFLVTYCHIPHDELVRCTLCVINKLLREIPEYKASPIGASVHSLGVGARGRVACTELLV